MTAEAETWTRQRNLSFREERVTLVYLLGRYTREALPTELVEYLLSKLRLPLGTPTSLLEN